MTAALTRCNSAHGSYGENDMSVTPIISPDSRTNTSDFAILFHPELYRCGTINALCHTLGNIAQRYNITEEQARAMGASEAYNESAGDGGTGVAYLKSKGATITVAIGNVTDRKDATIALEAKTPLRDAVKIIAETLAKQNRAFGVAA